MSASVLRQQAGATHVEYAIMIALVATVSLGAWSLLGETVSEETVCVADAIGGGGVRCGPRAASERGVSPGAGRDRGALTFDSSSRGEAGRVRTTLGATHGADASRTASLTFTSTTTSSTTTSSTTTSSTTTSSSTTTASTTTASTTASTTATPSIAFDRSGDGSRRALSAASTTDTDADLGVSTTPSSDPSGVTGEDSYRTRFERALDALDDASFPAVAGDDGRITRADLENVRDNPSRFDADTRAAAEFLLWSAPALNAVDVAHGGDVDGKISSDDLRDMKSDLTDREDALELGEILADAAAGEGDNDHQWSQEDLAALANDPTVPESVREWARAADPNVEHGCGWYRVDCHVANAAEGAWDASAGARSWTANAATTAWDEGTDALHWGQGFAERLQWMMQPPLDPRQWGDWLEFRAGVVLGMKDWVVTTGKGLAGGAWWLLTDRHADWGKVWTGVKAIPGALAAQVDTFATGDPGEAGRAGGSLGLDVASMFIPGGAALKAGRAGTMATRVRALGARVSGRGVGTGRFAAALPRRIETRAAQTVRDVERFAGAEAALRTEGWLRETSEHVQDVDALMERAGLSSRRATWDHDFSENVPTGRLRDWVERDGLQDEWPGQLLADAERRGAATVDLSKLNARIAEGLSREQVDPLALGAHRLVPHHSGPPGGWAAADETALGEHIADIVAATRQSRHYSPDPMPYDRIRAILTSDIESGKLPPRAAPLIDRMIAAQKELESERGLARGLCFAAGTEVERGAGRFEAIERLDVGARVHTLGAPSDGATAVDSSWRRVRLVMADPEGAGGVLDVELLRPSTWMDALGATEGGEVHLTLDTMGVEGDAQIRAIEPAPTIEPGDGRVVLSTIASTSSELLRVHFVGTDEVLEPTARHPLYSIDRAAWVRAGDLRAGEHLRARDGEATVASIERVPGAHRVYNIEVETEHTFLVSELGVLSHNDHPCAQTAAPQPRLVTILDEEPLGVGRENEVFAADLDGHEVAVKFPREDTPESRARIREEEAAQRELRNVTDRAIPVLAWVRHPDGRIGFATPRIDGATLDAAVKDRSFAISDSHIASLRQIFDDADRHGVHYDAAHADNVMLDRSGNAWLTDTTVSEGATGRYRDVIVGLAEDAGHSGGRRLFEHGPIRSMSTWTGRSSHSDYMPFAVETRNGRQLVYNVPFEARAVTRADVALFRRLEAYGGPRVVGIRKTPDGRSAVVIERPNGANLMPAYSAAQLVQMGIRDLPESLRFPAVTEEHLRSAERLFDQLEREGLQDTYGEWGRLLITDDGRVVPIDPSPGAQYGGADRGHWREMVMEKLQMIHGVSDDAPAPAH